MAPTRSKKRKSTESQSSVDVQSFPAPPAHTTTMKMRDPNSTPICRSPIKKAPRGITVNQKQALIDNLQLEITERARKLRAQYTMQAQGLRTRIEIRVNRIPMALRKANMGELFMKHNEVSKSGAPNNTSVIVRKAVGSPSKNLIQESQSNARHSPSPMRPSKRLSDEMVDKENDDLTNPRKRAKGPIAQNTSRPGTQAAQVLSPRSANSRNLPKSPVRPRPAQAPGKSQLSRPVSPLKPQPPAFAGGASSILTNMVERAKATRTTATRKVTASSSASSTGTSGRGTRPPPAAASSRAGKGRVSNSSQSTDTSSGTTVVRKTVTQGSPVKRTVMGTVKKIEGTVARKAAAAKAAAPTRVLRKRN